VALLHGILAMLVSPFTNHYQLNDDALRRQVCWALDNGTQGIVATPSIGEFLHLDRAERLRASGKPRSTKHASRPECARSQWTSGATTLETLEFSQHATCLGFDARQVIPPYTGAVSELEVERHYRMVAEAGDLPIVIYHNPALSKFHISPRFAGRLAAIPNIVAMK
jgi:4-hydroxy-tetrahydrodipicolinate synthase